MRQRALEAFHILNDLMADLIASTRTPDIVDRLPRLSPRVRHVMGRMCFSYLILSLAKWIEFYERYGAVIPKAHRPHCKVLYKALIARGVRDFRNKAVGHVWDYDEKRPLTADEINSYLAKVTGENAGEFLLWVNKSGKNVFPESVVSVVETVRDTIRSEYKLRDDEIFPKNKAA